MFMFGVSLGQIHLSAGCEIADGSAKTGQKDSLEIRTPERTYYVYAPQSATSKADIDDWQAALLRVTKKGAPKEKKGKVRSQYDRLYKTHESSNLSSYGPNRKLSRWNFACGESCASVVSTVCVPQSPSIR